MIASTVPKMTETNVSAAKVFNYISGIGGFAEFSKLLKHPSPLAKKGNASSVVFWYQEEDMSGAFDGTYPLILASNKYGSVFGIRINLKKKICLKYSSTGLCHLGSKCECWHICKAFLEGTCKGNCGNSHDFHDNDNKGKAAELGFEKKENSSLKVIIAGSLPQVCLSYLKNECVTVNCPYVHVCPKQVQASPCSCALSHDFSDSHNKNIFSSHFTFKFEKSLEKEALRCSILVPTKQKPIEDNLKQLELHQEQTKMQALSESKEINDLSAKATSSTEETKMAVVKGKASSSQKGTKPLPAEKPDPPQSQGVTPSVSDCLPKKVFNYLCNQGGFVTLTDLLQKNSPLGKKSCEDAILWLQAQSNSGQNTFFNLLKDGRDEVFGVQLLLRKKLCLQYSKGSCTKSKCNYWHICKGFLEGKCQGDCGLSHNFHDERNLKNIKKFELEKLPNKRVKDIVVNSLPQICHKYTENMCFSTTCPYLHVCSLTAQGKSCSCNLSHDLVNADVHNKAILEQFDLVPEASKLEIVLCNILVPQQQRNLNDNKVSVDHSFSSKSNLSLQNVQASPAPLPLAPQKESAVKSSVKKTRKKTRRKKKQLGAQTTERDATEDIEGNLISFSDDDWNDVTDPVDNCFLSNYELLSQMHDVPFPGPEDQHGKQGVLGASSQMAQCGFPAQVASEIQKLQRPPDLPSPLVPLPQYATTVAPNLLPLDWTAIANDEEYIRVPLALGSDGFKLAKSLFVKSMPESKATILAIERVQNPFLWEKYARKREHLEKRSRLASSQSNERILFYGAKQENIESICADNIDCRGQNEKGVAAFGQGAYFTTEASLSNTYSKPDSEGVRYMFLADVLVGSYTKGDPSLTRPPHKGDVAANRRYDSCVDNTDRPTIYVLFDSDQYYPNYLIQYRIKSKVACSFTKAVG